MGAREAFELGVACAVELVVLDGLAHRRAHQHLAAVGLSTREWEIANLVARGMTNRDIAERLVVSTRTVEGHVYRMFAKLNITDREGLAALIRGND